MFPTNISTSQNAADIDHVITCPNCYGDNYEDNRVDEALFREAAREAPRLRHEGRDREAANVLIALYAIRIGNFLRPELRCLSCGVKFDA